jgi:hypothetical protein
MVKMQHRACNRIFMLDVRSLADVARAAGERPVGWRISALAHEGPNVFDLKRKVEDGFGRLAILTAMPRP